MSRNADHLTASVRLEKALRRAKRTRLNLRSLRRSIRIHLSMLEA